MNKIHPLSQITTLADFDFFSVPPTQLSIEKNYVTEHRPISMLNPTSIIEFIVNSSIDEYIHLKDSMFYIKLRFDIKKSAGGDITAADWAKFQPVNNLQHSMFKSIIMESGGDNLSGVSHLYHYESFFETWLGYTGDAKAGYLCASMYYDDTIKKGAVDKRPSEWVSPTTVKTSGEGKYIELMGKLHLDMSFQPKALIGGTKLKFTFIPNDKNFYVWHDSTITSTVEFDKAALYIARSKVALPVVEAHNLALTKGTLKYPLMRSNVKSFTILSGQSNVNIDNAITGQIPRRMFFAMVDSTAFNGTSGTNPFKFEHFDLCYLTVSIDGVQYPNIAYTPNFKEDLFIREYLSLYETLNQLTSEPTIMLNKSEYKNGNTVIGFTFSPDATDDCNKVGYVNPIKYGTLNLNMRFDTALTKNINVLLYCEYDNLIQIDATRKPILDFI